MSSAVCVDVLSKPIGDARSAGAVEGVRRAILATADERECPVPAVEQIPARFAGGEPKASDLWPVAAHEYLDGVRAAIGAVTGAGEPGWFERGPAVVSEFVSALAAAEWVETARDVADVLTGPSKWDRMFAVWEVLGSPSPSDAGDGAVVWSVCTWAFDAISGTGAVRNRRVGSK
ncbi:hypothetical protein [Rhodococcoides fascians]|uniref:hypothetical protein n=1 Tax=Rhodococcoides fascians TaxID=1828 RepID=UPI003670C830